MRFKLTKDSDNLNNDFFSKKDKDDNYYIEINTLEEIFMLLSKLRTDGEELPNLFSSNNIVPQSITITKNPDEIYFRNHRDGVNNGWFWDKRKKHFDYSIHINDEENIG